MPEPLVIAATLPAGSPAFDSDGKLLGLDDSLELQANSPQYLAQYYMEGKVPDANQLMPGMLPVAREDQWIVSTTVASIAALKDARHSIMLYTFSPQMLMQVVQALRAAEQKHGLLEDYELGFLQASSGTYADDLNNVVTCLHVLQCHSPHAHNGNCGVCSALCNYPASLSSPPSHMLC